MKIKKLGLGVILLAGAFVFTSCGKKNTAKENNNDNGDVTSVSTTTDTSTNNGQSTTTQEPSLPSQVSITIDEIDSKSVLNTIYEDFKKPKLPTSYVELVRDVFKNSLNLDEDVQKAMVTDVDCLSAKGVEIADGKENPFLMDSAQKLSSDEAYIGNALTPVIVNLANYVDDLIDYETNIHNEISNPKYYFYTTKDNQTFFIIQIESKDGSNKDLIVINGDGVGSYINYAEHDYKFETVLEEKGKLTEDDKEILNSQPYIKYNNDGCQYKIVDYTVTELTVPGSYRTVPFNDIDLNDLDKCDNLEAINLNGSNKYKVIDGALYNKDATELLYYPKAKKDLEYTLPSTIKTIGEGVLSKNKYIESIILSEGITKIPDYFLANSNISKIALPSSVTTIGKSIFKGCKNLKEITVPFMGANEDSTSSLLYFFSKEEVEGMNKYDSDNGSYYIPSIEKLTITKKLSGESALNGLEGSLKELTFSDTITNLDSSVFNENLTALETINVDGLTTIPSRAFPNLPNLKNVYGKNIKTVSDYAFETNTTLENFPFDNVTSIGDYAFASTNIDAVESESILTVGQYAFNECKKLTTVDLKNATSVGQYAFFNTTSLSSASFASLETLETCFVSSDNGRMITTLNLPSMKILNNKALYNISTKSNIDVSNVTDIDVDAFRLFVSSTSELNFSSITSLPKLGKFSGNTYTTAFQGCNVKTVKFPNLTYMPYLLFYNSQVKNVYLDKVEAINYEGFYDCSTLVSLVAPKATIAGTRCFCNCSNLSTLQLGKLTSIGIYSFKGCNKITTVDISGVTSIPERAFYNCNLLNNIDTSNATSIDAAAFASCSSLTSVNLINVTTVGDSAFESCTSLASIGTYNKLATVGKSAFMNTRITKFSSKVVTSLGEKAFALCDKLTTLELTVTSIPASLCSNCYLLETVNFSKATSIASGVFGGCLSIKSLKLPLINSYTASLFGTYSYNFTNAYIELGVTELTDVVLSDVKLFNEIKLANITSIGEKAFEKNTKITSINCGSVTTIGNYCFNGCTNLSSISLPSLSSIGYDSFFGTAITSFTNTKITSIPTRAFYGCNYLTDISFSSATSVGSEAFEYCKTLKNVSLPKVTTASSYAFYGCYALEEISLPLLTKIEGYAFANTSALTSVSFPKVTSLAKYAFKDSSLKTIELPAIETIPQGCFQNTQFETIKLRALKTIPVEAFKGLTTLKTVDISSVTEVGNTAFQSCRNLSSVSGSNITRVGDYSFQYTAIYSMPSKKIQSIGTNAFYECKSLSLSVYSEWTDYLTSIASGAFQSCTSITGLKFTNSSISIGASAFYGCTGITSVYMPSSATINSGAFSSLSGHQVRITGTNSATLISNTSTIDSWGGIFSKCASVVCEDLRPKNLSGSVLVNTTYFDYKDLKSVNNGVTTYNYVGTRK